jgi:phosphoribosylaminoimidazole-succinocarboxamide synthase
VTLINKGKVKDVYETDRDTLIFAFSDRVSAFDVVLKDPIPFKGKILCDFAVYWFEKLKVQNHFIKRVNTNMIEVKKLNMIPLEIIIRQFLYGSLYQRYIDKQIHISNFDKYFMNRDLKMAARLPQPIFDPTTKSSLHDVPITEQEILKENILSEPDLSFLIDSSMKVFNQVNSIVSKAGFLLADIKFEFGRDPKNNVIYLADSIGPDEFRIWDKNDYEEGKVQKSYDKQILRDWLNETGFKAAVEESRAKHTEIKIPELPQNLISQLSEGYISAYERITGLEFKDKI